MTRSEQKNDITLYNNNQLNSEETQLQTIELPLQQAIYLKQVLASKRPGNQDQLASFFKDMLSGNDEIIDSRDAITMLSVGSVFAMACAMILMMAFQTVFFKRLLLLH